MSTAAEQFIVYTIEDIYNLPDGQRAELMDGRIYMMAAPDRVHQKIVKDVTYFIEDHIRHKNGDCEVYPSPFAVYLNADNTLYLEPDVSVICDKKKLTEKGCNGAPDWVVEVVSPSSRSLDYNKKLLKYGTAGVREYWIADPVKQRITVYNFEYDTVEEYSFSQKVRAGIFGDLEIDFSEINIE